MTSSSPDSSLIRLTDVNLCYEHERPVLSDVNLTVRRGDFIAITGPNGGGKTSLMRIMLRLLRPTSGRVEYFNARGQAAKRLHIGYLPQKSHIDTRFPITVRETVASGLLRGWFGQEADAERKLESVIDLVGIREYMHRRIGALSGGQLQRTLLGRALVSDPEILMLDEPLSYVDNTFEQQIYSLVKELSTTKTIVLVTHQMSIIAGMANRHLIVDHSVHECTGKHHYLPPDCQ